MINIFCEQEILDSQLFQSRINFFDYFNEQDIITIEKIQEKLKIERWLALNLINDLQHNPKILKQIDKNKFKIDFS